MISDIGFGILDFGFDVVVLFTEWNQYRALDLQEIKAKMKTPIFVDLRNVYSPKQMKEAGFTYVVVGREKNS